ncbi:hypothetical protein VTN00DRAFT_4934 [Thermoascus crustaceus]|uniref:uncharacterized protein n=1 Tax=Thermoascus crustaceus TaxID=5088 RepID=UPI0037434D08
MNVYVFFSDVDFWSVFLISLYPHVSSKDVHIYIYLSVFFPSGVPIYLPLILHAHDTYILYKSAKKRYEKCLLTRPDGCMRCVCCFVLRFSRLYGILVFFLWVKVAPQLKTLLFSFLTSLLKD